MPRDDFLWNQHFLFSELISIINFVTQRQSNTPILYHWYSEFVPARFLEVHHCWKQLRGKKHNWNLMRCWGSIWKCCKTYSKVKPVKEIQSHYWPSGIFIEFEYIHFKKSLIRKSLRNLEQKDNLSHFFKVHFWTL